MLKNFKQLLALTRWWLFNRGYIAYFSTEMASVKSQYLQFAFLNFRKMGKRMKSKTQKKATKGKLDTLLDKMPEILENANAAALAHAKALDKWQKKFDVISSDSEE